MFTCLVLKPFFLTAVCWFVEQNRFQTHMFDHFKRRQWMKCQTIKESVQHQYDDNNTHINGEFEGLKRALNLECGFPGMTSIWRLAIKSSGGPEKSSSLPCRMSLHCSSVFNTACIKGEHTGNSEKVMHLIFVILNEPRKKDLERLLSPCDN